MIQARKNFNNGSLELSAEISGEEFEKALISKTLNEMSKALTDYLMKNHFSELMALIDMQAVANMAIAQTGAAINETLQKKMPDVVQTIVEKEIEIYQRGVFGGIKRID
jgi:phage tail protein X